MISKDMTVGSWWQTGIVDIHPGSIRIHGYAIEDVIGRLGFVEMIWLMLRGDLPKSDQAKLLEAALVASVDHGPLAPSIAVARMAATCGLGINGAMASAVNTLGDVHGGAGQDCLVMMQEIAQAIAEAMPLDDAVASVVERHLEQGRLIPGFGHRLHPVDPRAIRLLEIVDQAAQSGVVNGQYATIARAMENLIAARKGRRLPMNIDGATAVIYGELGFEPALARGLFILSRSVGILAHANEQTKQGGRIKGPMPLSAGYTYTGEAPRLLPAGKIEA